MKKLILLLAIVGIVGAGEAQAAFLVKKKSLTTAVATTSAVGTTDHATDYEQVVTLSENRARLMKKMGLLRPMVPHAVRRGVTVPKFIYILMSVIGLGWLAIGINDTFSTWSWVIAFFLYCFFFLPGVIYSLVMMRGYYM